MQTELLRGVFGDSITEGKVRFEYPTLIAAACEVTRQGTLAPYTKRMLVITQMMQHHVRLAELKVHSADLSKLTWWQ